MKLRSRIKPWYISKYVTDELGKEIKSGITFEHLFRCLDSYGDVYELLGVSDSLVRERVFEQLAEIMECDYHYIYEQWLKSAQIH